jgi:hypothetical protein
LQARQAQAIQWVWSPDPIHAVWARIPYGTETPVADFGKNFVTRQHQQDARPAKAIVVYCTPFDEQSGGSIVLHYLVDRLRALKVEAYAQPTIKQYSYDLPGWIRTIKAMLNNRRVRRSFTTHPSMDVPIAPARILKRAVAVYPEIISGNPLGAPHVVRWLLNRKGFFLDTEFGADEMVVFYQAAFAQEHSGSSAIQLRLRWFRDDVYADRGLSGRRGNCRMIRKGARMGLAEVPEGDTAILLDGKPHEEVAAVFNSTELFYSHDPRTMYLYYAALCGCVPVIVPQPGKRFEDLRPAEEERWGIAYGDDGIPWARATRDRFIERFARERAAEETLLRDFVRAVAERFG